MLATHSRSLRTLLTSAAFLTLLLSGRGRVQAEETDLVELTFMLVAHPLDADTIPNPEGDRAIGLVLDGNSNPPSTSVWTEYGEFGSFGDSRWRPTDASYITKGGTSPVSVYVQDGILLPAHGFVNIRRSLIEESVEAFATFNSSTNELEFESDPSAATHFVLFVSGLFEVSWR